MKSWMRWSGFACAAAAVAGASAIGCGSDSPTSSSTTTGAGGEGTTTSSSSTTGAGGGATTASSTTTGAGGEGTTASSSSTTGAGGGTSTGSTGTGGAPGNPFTSQGPASYEAQTSIAVDSKGDVVAAWLGFFADNTSAVGYAISRDEGKTFTAPAYVKSPGGRLSDSPVVAVDKQGRFSLAWLGFGSDFNGPPDEHIYFSRLNDATETFPDPIIASDDGTSTQRDFNHPRITIDNSDNVLLTWSDFTAGSPYALTLARSTDGVSFTRSTIANDATFGNLADLCLDPAGGPTAPLYLVHFGNGSTVTLRRSTDQGAQWQILPVPATNVIFQDITCAAHGNDLWITYASGVAPFVSGENTPGDAISVVHSANGGTSFDAVVKASSGPTGTLYLFPRISRSPLGALEIAYYEGTVDNPAKLQRASSPSGAAWTVTKLADPGTFTLKRFLASWLGDYLGVAATSKGLFSSYTENSQGKAHIGFVKVAAP